MPSSEGYTVWLTGLPASGKTTLAKALASRLEARGLKTRVLDGDELRKTLSKDLGFSAADRDAHVLRVAQLCRDLNDQGIVAIAALISPYRETRRKAKALVVRWHEIFVCCPVEACAARDPKGLYKKAFAGEISGFTGVSAPYEEPLAPDVTVRTDGEGIETCVERILEHLGRRRIRLTPRQAADLGMILSGAYAPIDGFCRRRDYLSILRDMRLHDGRLWPIPLTLDLTHEEAAPLREGEEAYLEDGAGGPLAVLRVEDVYGYSKNEEARLVYGTEDLRHPGVAELFAQQDRLVGGRVRTHGGSPSGATPAALRAEFARRGWRRIAGFQTRNPVHRAHEELIRKALEGADGVLLHPLTGPVKDDDVPAPVRMRCYDALFPKYLPPEKVILAPYPAPMRYAGPREALLHALARANYGCTEFVVGRDAAGVGGFYGPYAAQELLKSFSRELPIRPLFFRDVSYCADCSGMREEGACGHEDGSRRRLSGTQLRACLSKGGRPPEELVRPEVAAVLADHYGRLSKNPLS